MIEIYLDRPHECGVCVWSLTSRPRSPRDETPKHQATKPCEGGETSKITPDRKKYISAYMSESRLSEKRRSGP